MNNNTNIINRNRIVKTLAGIGLGLSIAFTGSVLLPSQQVHAASASTNSSIADNITATGKQFMGVPYHFGAPSGRTDEFDCSSFTQYVFKQNGIDLPRTSRQQAQVGKQVSKDQLQPGDLVFSDTNRDGVINHVSIYIGNGQLLHTYRVGIGVTISDFSGSAWDHDFVTARRVIPDNGQGSGASQPANTPSKDKQSTDTQHSDNKTQNSYVSHEKEHQHDSNHWRNS